jgi:toxin ParE1/3/4
MTFSVVFSPEAQEQLVALYQYISEQGAPINAERYTNAIIDFCESLVMFPMRGMKRDDIRLGLRITNYRGSTIIAFAVNDKNETVSIVGIYYGGQDFESMFVQDQ